MTTVYAKLLETTCQAPVFFKAWVRRLESDPMWVLHMPFRGASAQAHCICFWSLALHIENLSPFLLVSTAGIVSVSEHLLQQGLSTFLSGKETFASLVLYEWKTQAAAVSPHNALPDPWHSLRSVGTKFSIRLLAPVFVSQGTTNRET